MIFGVGIDLVEIVRIKAMNDKHNQFSERLLTKKEFELFDRIKTERRRTEFLAGRWAAKEAFSKALGTGIGSQIHFHDIEIMQTELGQPYVDSVKYAGQIHISITHTANYAAAQVVLETFEN